MSSLGSLIIISNNVPVVFPVLLKLCVVIRFYFSFLLKPNLFNEAIKCMWLSNMTCAHVIFLF